MEEKEENKEKRKGERRKKKRRKLIIYDVDGSFTSMRGYLMKMEATIYLL